MFVKFDCGCIGIMTEDGHVIIIETCFYEGDPNSNPRFEFREGFSGEFVPLNQEEVGELVANLSGLVADGRKFRELKSLLKS
jgi:hypothetical protein